jgi:hypothetical protein
MVNINQTVERETRHEIQMLLVVWFFISAILILLATTNLDSPGLYYDEATSAGMAKDFVQGKTNALHMPGTYAVNIAGRPFPLFLQPYYGALKSWLMIPVFTVFTPTIAVVRLTSMLWSLAGMLFFMLWARKFFGMHAVLIAAPMLAFDPSFYFLSVLDWGPIVPSILCRFAGFYFSLLWLRHRKAGHGFLAAVFMGMGLFSKIDFIIVIAGCGIAALISFWNEVVRAIRDAPVKFILCCAGFLLAAAPMSVNLRDILQAVMSGSMPDSGDELLTKLYTFFTMYDGSYILRLMKAGGVFETMYNEVPGMISLFGLAALSSFIYLSACVLMKRKKPSDKGAHLFLLISMTLITSGIFLMPGAIRLHHATLVYPFPHLIIASAASHLWQRKPEEHSGKRIARIAAVIMIAGVMYSHFNALYDTQHLLRTTGGSGRWSNSLTKFAEEVSDRKDITIVSLDWGFNEQLEFLVNGPRLSEPFWFDLTVPALLNSPVNYVYLVYPREYSLFPQGAQFLEESVRLPSDSVSIKPYKDGEGDVAFYAIQRRH